MVDELTSSVSAVTCGGCETAVQRAVSMLDGVSHVTASHRDNRVTLTCDAAKIDREASAKPIEAVWYTVAPV